MLKETGATVISAGKARAKPEELRLACERDLAQRLEVVGLDAAKFDGADWMQIITVWPLQVDPGRSGLQA